MTLPPLSSLKLGFIGLSETFPTRLPTNEQPKTGSLGRASFRHPAPHANVVGFGRRLGGDFHWV